MKKIFTLLVLLLFINSCSNQEIIWENEKKDFLIETKKIADFSNNTFLEKTAKISSSQNINLTSLANARVSTILVKEWNNIKKWQILAKLEDNIWNYWLNLQRAKNWLDRAQINYDSTKINLDKAIFEAELNLDKLNKNLIALKENARENIKLAENDLNNLDYNNIDSKSALELQKFDNTISKAELDYNNKLIADSETIKSFYSSLKKEYTNAMLFMDDIITFSDEILWVTDANKDKNNSFENYLWAKNTIIKNNAEFALKDLIEYRENEFKNINISSISWDNLILETLLKLEKAYSQTRNLLNLLESTFNNSIESVWSLSNTDISTYIWKVNWYQASVQWNYTAFLAFETSTKSFLRTYLNTQESMLKSLELLKKDREILKKTLTIWWESAEIWYNKTIISSNDSIDSLELQIKSLQNALENAIKTKEVTHRSLNNNIKEAKISYDQALNDYSKLNITSPISWTIAKINIDVWQEVNTQTQAFEIKNNNSSELNISFNKKELDFVSVWKEVLIDYEWKTSTWTIVSISQVADSNLKYLSIVSIPSELNLIWNIVTLKIPIETKYKLLPINIVKINSSWVWILNILEWELIKQIDVKLWEIFWDKIQIIDSLEDNINVITSYVDNFDPDKFILKVK